MDTVDGTNADADVTSTRMEAMERHFMIALGRGGLSSGDVVVMADDAVM